MLSGVDPLWLNALALIYLASRVGHMLCYYIGQK
ncbi:MAPEG family protein [Pseudoalteromonas rubra]